MPQGFNDDTISVIPEDILHDGCEIVGFNVDEMNEVDHSQERMDEDVGDSFLDLSEEMSDTSAQMSDSVENINFDDPR